MKIINLELKPDWRLLVTAEDGRRGILDVHPYLDYEAFLPLKDPVEFARIKNGGYYIEWACGADLSADTIEARWKLIQEAA